MRLAKDWVDYELIDTSDGERLERWGDIILVRPDPQIIWSSPKLNRYWEACHARYVRSKAGGGSWDFYKKFKQEWNLTYKRLKFLIKPTGFKHMGLFPEQAINWEFIINKIKGANRPINVINLFAYTGGASLAGALAGAKVCHVDSSKGVVSWAKENSQLTGLKPDLIRWIIDDCNKFITRESKRNRKYDVIILDPPSYGRGPGGEIWKLEENIFELLKLSLKVLSDKPLFIMLNSYSSGLSSGVMSYLLKLALINKYGKSIMEQITVDSQEIGLRVSETGLNLPCGNTTIVEFG